MCCVVCPVAELLANTAYVKYIYSFVGQKISCCIAGVTSSIVDKFKESLLHFQKDACDICYVLSKCYNFTLQ